MEAISKETLQFLSDLKDNNNREWFNSNKERYKTAHEEMIHFADDLLNEMNQVDQIETPNGKKSLMRIYRDVRFSPDKSPYKKNFGGGLKRATSTLRGGYYYHIQPGQSFVGGGFWGPNSDDLKRIREELHNDDSGLRKIINSKSFKQYFGELKGETVKTAPKGFQKDDPAIDLIRHKQFVVMRSFTDAEVLDPEFLSEVVKTYSAMLPFLDYMSEVLTTDLDGRSLVD